MITKVAASSLSYVNEFARLQESCIRILSLCNSNSLREGLHIHSLFIKLALHENLHLCNNLLRLYSKTEGICSAKKLFDEMPERDDISCTVMISAYTKSRKLESALEVFDEMMACGIRPNEFTFSSVLRSCSGLADLEYGARVHGAVVKSGFEANPVICSGLVDLYSKCGRTKEARELFESTENSDTVSWTTMISSMVETRKWSEALKLYVDMLEARVPPNEFTYVKLLGASSFLGLEYGKQLHAHVIVRGVLVNVVLKTALIDFYSRVCRMEEAARVLNTTWDQDVFLWTSVVSGFARNLKCTDAVAAFHEMQDLGFSPNIFTYSALLSMCSSVQSLDLGKQIHSRVIKVGMEDSIDVGNALMDMYMKCSSMEEDALRVFRAMSSPNVISWTTLISGLVDHGFEKDCFILLTEMVTQGVHPNAITLSGVLRACSRMKLAGPVLEIHGYTLRRNINGETIAGNSIVDAYASSGKVNYAWSVATSIHNKDNITYTSLVTRLNELGNHEMSLRIIDQMREDGIEMDQFSLAGFISASANLGALETGKSLHCHSVKSGFSHHISVSNTTVDMYGKYGSVKDAKKAFEEIPEPDVVSWNGLISGLASNGCIALALSAFEDMLLKGIKPDSVTFSVLLSACSSNGKLTEMGLEYFRSMSEIHNIEPRIEHYVCLVEMLGRAGRLEEAVGVLETMPLEPNTLLYKTLLRACRFHLNLPLGEDMANRGISLAPSDPAFYILLADLYDDSDKPELAQKIRQLMKERGLSKKPSKSSVQVHGKVHSFASDDAKSAETEDEIHGKIESVKNEFRSAGHRYRDSEDSSFHTAKRAVAFALLNSSPEAPVHVVKNKILCRDCHSFMNLTARLLSRCISVRDGNQIHSFNNGDCSCKGETSFVQS